MKKKPLSHDEHVEMGQRLQRIQIEWQEAYIELANRYGVTNTAVRKMKAANDQLCEARSRMDSQCYIDDPAQFTAHIYYPDPPNTPVTNWDAP